MSIGLFEYELEGIGETESELEAEFEDESEWEDESELEGESEYESEAELEDESELEGEYELEGEGEISPVSKVYPDAMMEHLAHVAMEAESEAEAAEGFLPLVPMIASKLLPLAARALPRIAGRALPKIARQVSRVTPNLVRGVTNITRVLHRNPATRRLIGTVPSIARRTVTTIARRAAAGRPVSPQLAARILAHHRRRVLRNPRMVRKILGRSNVMDRRYHRLAGLPRRAGWRYGWRGPMGYSLGAPRIAGPGTVARPYAYRGRGWRRYPAGARGYAGRFCPRCGTTTIPAPRGSVVVVR
jgi:hypothetical protein